MKRSDRPSEIARRRAALAWRIARDTDDPELRVLRLCLTHGAFPFTSAPLACSRQIAHGHVEMDGGDVRLTRAGEEWIARLPRREPPPQPEPVPEVRPGRKPARGRRLKPWRECKRRRCEMLTPHPSGVCAGCRAKEAA